MSYLSELQRIKSAADENFKLARDELGAAKALESLAKSEINQAKAREKLMERELEIEKIREELAEKTRKLVDKKIQVNNDGLIEFPNDELEKEKRDAVHSERIAEIKREIAQFICYEI